MTWFRALIAVFFLAFCVLTRADGPDDSYVKAYHLIQEGDQFRGTSQADLSRAKYLEAQAILKKIQAIYPNWSSKAVEFRLNYIEEKLGTPATTKPEPAESPARPPAKPVPPAVTKPAPAPKPAPDARDVEIQGLNDTITRLQTDNSVLQAKLKEALSAQPAVVDPKDLARAEERIRNLEKEKDLLKVSLEQEQASKSKLVDPGTLEKAQSALDNAKKELAEQTNRLNALAQEKTILETKLTATAQESEAARNLKQENEQLKKQVAEAARMEKTAAAEKQLAAATAAAKKEIAEQNARLNALAEEKAVLETKLTAANQHGEAARNLKQENEQLKKQLAELSRADKTAAIEKQLTAAQASIDELKTEKAALQAVRADKKTATEKQLTSAQASIDELKKEKATLEARLNAAPPKTSSDSNKVRQLEQEKEDLQRKLSAVTRDMYESKRHGKTNQVAQLLEQIAVLRARLEVFETKKSPYTEEELALFKAPAVATAEPAPKTAKKTMRELPAGSGGLATEAQRAFAAHRYDEAEQKYLQVLKLDDKNVFTLGNLAATQLEQGRFDDAEANLKKALSEDPGDGYSLSLMGIVKFRQGKFDDALDLLSKAAEVDPQNPETQNYLGITLSQKGQRGPAEAALRKAIQIAPNYAGAHHNLAVVYATQQPPSRQLARWHYDKAIANGHPRNPDLEKMLDQGQSK